MINEHAELMELIQSIVVEVIGNPLPDVPPEMLIEEIGIDSISVAEIITRLEDKLGIEVPASQWLRARTFQDFIEAIDQARQK